jgi:hypothetical protein
VLVDELRAVLAKLVTEDPGNNRSCPALLFPAFVVTVPLLPFVPFLLTALVVDSTLSDLALVIDERLPLISDECLVVVADGLLLEAGCLIPAATAFESFFRSSLLTRFSLLVAEHVPFDCEFTAILSPGVEDGLAVTLPFAELFTFVEELLLVDEG